MKKIKFIQYAEKLIWMNSTINARGIMFEIGYYVTSSQKTSDTIESWHLVKISHHLLAVVIEFTFMFP